MVKWYDELCSPARVYLLISAVTLALIIVQNGGNTDTYCVGNLECSVPSTAAVFIGKALYVAFWTWALDQICRAKITGRTVAWYLVLIPYILMALGIALMMLFGGKHRA